LSIDDLIILAQLINCQAVTFLESHFEKTRLLAWCLPEIATDEKSNEITAVRKLLKTLCLDFKGTIRAVGIRQARPSCWRNIPLLSLAAMQFISRDGRGLYSMTLLALPWHMRPE
jgi:hypothetical protein